LWGIREVIRESGDDSFLKMMLPSVNKAADYLIALRKERMTKEYELGDLAACYGLLPESASHEGYLAHPVHAYWDDFWALRGLRDATIMAEVLGDQAQAQRIAELRDSFRETLYASIDATMSRRQIDYIPGSVEW